MERDRPCPPPSARYAMTDEVVGDANDGGEPTFVSPPPPILKPYSSGVGRRRNNLRRPVQENPGESDFVADDLEVTHRNSAGRWPMVRKPRPRPMLFDQHGGKGTMTPGKFDGTGSGVHQPQQVQENSGGQSLGSKGKPRVTSGTEEGGHRGRRGRGSARCFGCQQKGHLLRDCPRKIAEQRRPSVQLSDHQPSIPPFCAGGARSMYVRGTVNGYQLLCLVDTGAETNVLPVNYATGLQLRKTSSSLHAANGTAIETLGKVMLTVRFGKNCRFNVNFVVVSDKVYDTILGMDFLIHDRVEISLGGNAIFVGAKRIQLVKKDGAAWCRYQYNW